MDRRVGLRARTDFRVIALRGPLRSQYRGIEVSPTGIVLDRGRPIGDLDSPLYSVAKAAVIVLTEQLVRECQPASVRVNTLLPPHRAASIPAGKSPATLVAEAAEFLLSDRAYLTNGACLDASGGWALH